MRERIIILNNSLQALTIQEKDLNIKLEPIVKENAKLQKIIPEIEKQNEEMQEKIVHLEKLNELSSQLKNVNLEELKLLTQSNEQISLTIGDLSRKWTHLKNLTKNMDD